MATPSLKSSDFIRTTLDSAYHFGFRPLKELADDPRCKTCVPEKHKILVAQRKTDALHGALTSGLANYFEHRLHGRSEPAFFYTLNESKADEVAITLSIIGVEKSIAEALLIHTLRTILNDLSITEHVLRINSMGDRESLGRYVRELTTYFKKRIETLPGPAREMMKEHVLFAFNYLLEREHEYAFKSPTALEHLNEQSRKHFREIVEYLDQSNAAYEIDPRLMGHHQCYAHTLFTFDTWSDEARTSPSSIRIRGGRYDEFSYHLTKKNVPAVGAVITLKGQRPPVRLPKQGAPAPHIFIVQLGFGPKMRTLNLIDELKRAGIYVHQALTNDSLGAQLEIARAHNIPHTLIIGQKEYVEKSVIVRNMHTSSQEHVSLNDIIPYLKKVAKVSIA